jgi:hypothetical protein
MGGALSGSESMSPAATRRAHAITVTIGLARSEVGKRLASAT